MILHPSSACRRRRLIGFSSLLLILLLPFRVDAFPVDFDGDGKTDPTIYRPAFGEWYMLPSTGFCPYLWTVIGPGQCKRQWGLPGDKPLVGDYDQDGKGDPTVYRPSNQHFYITYSSFSGSVFFQFPDGSGGVQPSPSDIPDIADVNNDGRSDILVYKPKPVASSQAYARVFENNAITVYSGSLRWYEDGKSLLPLQAASQNYVASTGGIYFGDEAGLAWRNVAYSGFPAYAFWAYNDVYYGSLTGYTGFDKFPNVHSQRLARGNFSGFAFDTDEYALFDTSTGIWRFRRPAQTNWTTQAWGLAGDIPVPGDYTGNGVTDFAVWRPSTGTWFMLVSPCPTYAQPTGYGGCFRQWGLSNDIPVSR